MSKSEPKLDYKIINKKPIETDASLTKLILSFYAIPGQDATYRMRLKDEDGNKGLCIGKHGPYVDLAIRSCVSMITILKFECDIPSLRAHCLDLFKSSALVNSVCRETLDRWEKTKAGTKDFLNYITDERSAIMYTWLYTFQMMPMTVLQNSLHNFVWKSRFFQSEKFDDNLSIFGIKGL
jgi:hypothetical protein